jgi:hypothetical protein
VEQGDEFDRAAPIGANIRGNGGSMSKLQADTFDLETLRIDPNDGELMRLARVPAKIRKRREQFIRVPWAWLEKLRGAPGQTIWLAVYLLHLHWVNHGKPFTLANGMLRSDGLSRQSKWRALADLERIGLVEVRRQKGKSPTIHLPHF